MKSFAVSSLVCLGLAACSAASEARISDRLAQIESDCGMLATQAAFQTGGEQASNFCHCMVQVLENRPDVQIDAIGQTLDVVASEHLQSGAPYEDIAAKLHTEAGASNASDRSRALGLGLQLVKDVSGAASDRSRAGSC